MEINRRRFYVDSLGRRRRSPVDTQLAEQRKRRRLSPQFEHGVEFLSSEDEYNVGKRRRFGEANPQSMNDPFWLEMVRTNAIAYTARTKFDDRSRDPVWCFARNGQSATKLPDGRIIHIGGEHEDWYDQDFCIYNDVIVHHGDGRFDIYGYPRDDFPPSDFHSATRVGNHIYIIGSMGYPEDRKPGSTQGARLNIHSLRMELLATTGDTPGWLFDHGATLVDGHTIRVSGGKVWTGEKIVPTTADRWLDLRALVWRADE